MSVTPPFFKRDAFVDLQHVFTAARYDAAARRDPANLMETHHFACKPLWNVIHHLSLK